MQDRRKARFESLLKEEISNIISREVKNPNVGLVTITRVEVTPDYTKAKVYFRVIPEEKEEETLKALTNSAGFIRHLLKKSIRARIIPSLEFKIDKELKVWERIWTEMSDENI